MLLSLQAYRYNKMVIVVPDLNFGNVAFFFPYSARDVSHFMFESGFGLFSKSNVSLFELKPGTMVLSFYGKTSSLGAGGDCGLSTGSAGKRHQEYLIRSGEGWSSMPLCPQACSPGV